MAVPKNKSLTSNPDAPAKAWGEAELHELDAALADARGNLGFWQISGNSRRIEEAEENVAYLQELRDKREKG